MAPILRWLAVAAVVAGLAGCGSASRQSAPTTTTNPTTTSRPPSASRAPTTTVKVARTTTTTGLPGDPQPSADAASQSLIDAWEAGERGSAAGVATASAIRSIFARPYSGEVLVDRGCTSPGPNPVVCSWGPDGGASPTNPLYELTMLTHGPGWYVEGVIREG